MIIYFYFELTIIKTKSIHKRANLQFSLFVTSTMNADEQKAAWVLARDLTNVIFKQGTRACVVLSGTFKDPYTGETIEHVRGGGKVDIDHVVALGQAWASGAQQLTEQERTWLANDPMNLMASDASANRQKGDKEASAWLPPNKSFRCEYVSRQIMVKSKYKLSVTKAEKTP